MTASEVESSRKSRAEASDKEILNRLIFIMSPKTGIKDIRGRDIREGDIVKILHPNHVSEEHEEHLVKVKRICEVWNITEGHKCDIIGNIHSHPELLERTEN